MLAAPRRWQPAPRTALVTRSAWWLAGLRAGLQIRLKGRNMTESEHVKLGAYHTLELELHRAFTLHKARNRAASPSCSLRPLPSAAAAHAAACAPAQPSPALAGWRTFPLL
jgi:hypothetical protein